MRLKNIDKYPPWVQDALSNDSYDAGAIPSLSATGLLDSPRIKKLRSEHIETVEEDASRRIAALIGSGVHMLAEQHCKKLGWIVEQRFYASIDVGGEEKIISGQIDAIQPINDKDVVIWDWKTITSWKAQSGMENYVQQGNIYAFLLRKNGYNPIKFKIGAWLKDWRENQAKDKPDYPQLPFMTYEYDLWDDDACESYVNERARLHFGDEDYKCTDEERWVNQPKWEAIKNGNKTPTKLFDSMEEGLDWIKSGIHPKLKNSLQSDWRVVRKPKIYKRCEDNWCGVAEYCSQHQEYLKQKQEEL